MAIYKNREVQIMGPSPQANSPDSINVSYVDGTHENVKLSDVKFTPKEKEVLVKSYPSRYENVETVKEEDVKAVRIGLAPTFDKTEQLAAKAKAELEYLAEAAQKRAEDMKAKVHKDLASSPVKPQVT